jgi:hypothetical protein
MAQFVGLFPRSYADAEKWVKANETGNNEWSKALCAGCRLHRKGEAVISLECRGVDLVTWMATGRIKVNTLGRNDAATLAKINAALPAGYRAHKKGGAVHLDGPAGNVAVFLTSTIFRIGEAIDEGDDAIEPPADVAA